MKIRLGLEVGSLTLTARVGDRFKLQVPGAEPIWVLLRAADDGRATLNFQAPRAYQVDRVRRESEEGSER